MLCQSWAGGNGTCGGCCVGKGICVGGVLNESGFWEMLPSFQFVVGEAYICAASIETAGLLWLYGDLGEIWSAGRLLGAKVFTEGGELCTFAWSDILALMGVPQRGQILRFGESGNSHWEHLMLVLIPLLNCFLTWVLTLYNKRVKKEHSYAC
jgi:hypothetical protein